MSKPKSAAPLALAGIALLLSGCAGAGPGASFAERDPYENFNRRIHGFNLGADRYVLRPVAIGYDTVTPTTVQNMLRNFFNNFDSVNDFFNYMLQAEWESAMTAAGRVYINTFIGAGGLLDPATEFGLPKESSDFGVTLGKWGADEGAFLMFPFFGPSTTRDGVGRIGDVALSPQTYAFQPFDSNLLDIISPFYILIDGVDNRARNRELIDDILYNSEDSYVSLRAVYLQRRDSLIFGDDPEGENLPDIFDAEPAAADPVADEPAGDQPTE